MHKSISEQIHDAQAYQQRRQALITSGLQALNRLITVAVRPTGQGRVIGRFLLGLYNGPEYPFDLTELRGLDLAKFEDCLRVLMMDYSPEVEIHERVAERLLHLGRAGGHVGTEGGADVIVYFCANGISSEMALPSVYLENARAEDLAELAAGMFWRERKGEAPALVTLVHLQDVDGKDLGIFEVRRDMRPIFTATALPAA